MGKGRRRRRRRRDICLALRPPPLRLHHLHRKIKRPFQLLQSLSTLQASSSRERFRWRERRKRFFADDVVTTEADGEEDVIAEKASC
ncbi:hypothetical protein Bca4012_049832 [Brassica carinata]